MEPEYLGDLFLYDPLPECEIFRWSLSRIPLHQEAWLTSFRSRAFLIVAPVLRNLNFNAFGVFPTTPWNVTRHCDTRSNLDHNIHVHVSGQLDYKTHDAVQPRMEFRGVKPWNGSCRFAHQVQPCCLVQGLCWAIAFSPLQSTQKIRLRVCAGMFHTRKRKKALRWIATQMSAWERSLQIGTRSEQDNPKDHGVDLLGRLEKKKAKICI